MSESPGDAVERLEERLRSEGVPDAVIAAARAEGRLPGLAVEVALGGRGRHSLSWTAQKADVPAVYLREMLRAAGRPNPGRGELAFTDDDLEFARVVRILLDAGLPRRELVEVVRVTSQATSQAATAILALLGDALLRPGDTEEELGVRYADAAHELAPLLPVWVGYLLRGHLRDGVKDTLITEAERHTGSLSTTRHVGVGFADLVGYTRLGEQLATEDVGRSPAGWPSWPPPPSSRPPAWSRRSATRRCSSPPRSPRSCAPSATCARRSTARAPTCRPCASGWPTARRPHAAATGSAPR
jgi:adenylate cyclase